jgi:hypothetical protein
MELVAVDIGGTHARFALATVEGGRVTHLGEAVTLKTAEHASFQLAWKEFERQNGGSVPPACAIAVAGPVGGEVIKFTNNPWIIRPALIPEKLGADRYVVVNDFAAVAHAVAQADAEHFIHLPGRTCLCPKKACSAWLARAPGLAWRSSGAIRLGTRCSRPKAGISTMPRSTASRTRSWHACASAIAASRWSAWWPGRALSISMKRWP